MGRTTSFSANVKGELARIYPKKPCCRLAELAAIARLDGTVAWGSDGGVGFYMATEYSAVARKAYRLLKDQFSIEAELTVQRQARLKRRVLYHIRVADAEGVPDMLQALGILSPKRQILPGIKKDLVRNKCCRSSYLRGAFLGSGSVSSPDSGYHLELTVGNAQLGRELASLVSRFPGLEAKVSQRKLSYLVYLKDSNQIADFLVVMGAHGNLLAYENARVLKGLKNQVNRLVNCESANMDKTVEAAARQVANIRLIEARLGLDALDPSLALVAKSRLANPEANLKELGEAMSPPLGKSGVNHRLRKIGEIADGLRLGAP